eukprot:g4367.t1
MRWLLVAYADALKRRPFLTNVCTAVPMMIVGDCAAQTIEQRAKTRAQAAAVLRARNDEADNARKSEVFSRDDDQRNGENGNGICVERTFTCALYSATIFTPIFFTLYRLQDKYITAGSPVFVAAKKTVCSLLFGGVPANSLFLTLGTTLEMKVFGHVSANGDDWLTTVEKKLKEDVPRVVSSSVCFWLPINMVNFIFVRPEYRIIVAGLGAIFWNCFLSMVQHEYLDDTRAAPDRK